MLPKHAFPSWALEADRCIWSDVAQCMRVAGTEVQDVQHLRAAQTLTRDRERARLAYAVGEIAKARAMAAFIVDPDKRLQARNAINKMAACVRSERGA